MSDISNITALTTRVDEVDASNSYIGLANPGSAEDSPVWQIKKVTDVDTVTSILFANGNDFFLNKWTERASLTYS